MLDFNSCVICKYPITDPVCRDCYIKETKLLLNDLKVNSKISDFIKNKLKNKFPIETLNDTECIICKKENVTICRYCFSVNLIRTLRELNFTEDLIENFEYDQIYEESEEISLKNERIFENEMEMM